MYAIILALSDWFCSGWPLTVHRSRAEEKTNHPNLQDIDQEMRFFQLQFPKPRSNRAPRTPQPHRTPYFIKIFKNTGINCLPNVTARFWSHKFRNSLVLDVCLKKKRPICPTMTEFHIADSLDETGQIEFASIEAIISPKTLMQKPRSEYSWNGANKPERAKSEFKGRKTLGLYVEF